MLKTACQVSILGAIAVCLTILITSSADSQEQDKQLPDAKRDVEQSTFMRKKLEASTQILEGLTLEDSELLIRGAKALVEMSSAEKFQVKRDAMYRQFSGEFQRSARSLLEAAEKENFDAASLKWMDTTMKCLDCHKFVRGIRVASK